MSALFFYLFITFVFILHTLTSFDIFSVYRFIHSNRSVSIGSWYVIDGSYFSHLFCSLTITLRSFQNFVPDLPPPPSPK